MSTIVSWSPIHGQGGNTSNIVALAIAMALGEYTPTRSLLTHTQLTRSNMEFLFNKEKRSSFDDKGMDALERLVKSNLLKGDAIQDYTDTLIRDRLDLLAGSQKAEISTSKELAWRSVLEMAKLQYDFIWTDVHSGHRQALTLNLLEESDLVIVNLPQNRYVLDRFFNGDDFPTPLKTRDYIIVIGQYDPTSVLSLKNIKRNYNVKMPIYSISYSSEFNNALNVQRIQEYFYRECSKGNSQRSVFISELMKINHYIRSLLLTSNSMDKEGAWL